MKLPICINAVIVFIFVILLTNILYNTESFYGRRRRRRRRAATAKEKEFKCMEAALAGECGGLQIEVVKGNRKPIARNKRNWILWRECAPYKTCQKLDSIKKKERNQNRKVCQHKMTVKKAQHKDKIAKLKIQHQYSTDQMKQDYEQQIEKLDEDITQYESNLLDRNIEIQRLGEEIVDKQNNIDEITAQYAHLESDIKAKRTQSFSRQQL
tara:strand:- start:3724 stop:4356 length:633 start_codon:yes stop_codon:yes gene_type:complete